MPLAAACDGSDSLFLDASSHFRASKTERGQAMNKEQAQAALAQVVGQDAVGKVAACDGIIACEIIKAPGADEAELTKQVRVALYRAASEMGVSVKQVNMTFTEGAGGASAAAPQQSRVPPCGAGSDRDRLRRRDFLRGRPGACGFRQSGRCTVDVDFAFREMRGCGGLDCTRCDRARGECNSAQSSHRWRVFA